MNRIFLILLLSTVSLFANAPWPGVNYMEVRAFAWGPRVTQSKSPIRADRTFEEGVMNKDGVLLNDQQVKRLLAAQARRYTSRGKVACYSPHNAFVFYNAEKKPVAFLEVCFDCVGARMNPADEGCDPDFVALATLCAELKLPFGDYKSVEEFKKAFDRLLTPPDSKNTPQPKRKLGSGGNRRKETECQTDTRKVGSPRGNGRAESRRLTPTICAIRSRA